MLSKKPVSLLAELTLILEKQKTKEDYRYLGAAAAYEASAPDLLKAEIPLIRHIEKELASHGYEKGTKEYDKMFASSIAYYRQFGNIDNINKHFYANNKSQHPPKSDVSEATQYVKNLAQSAYGREDQEKGGLIHGKIIKAAHANQPTSVSVEGEPEIKLSAAQCKAYAELFGMSSFTQGSTLVDPLVFSMLAKKNVLRKILNTPIFLKTVSHYEESEKAISVKATEKTNQKPKHSSGPKQELRSVFSKHAIKQYGDIFKDTGLESPKKEKLRNESIKHRINENQQNKSAEEKLNDVLNAAKKNERLPIIVVGNVRDKGLSAAQCKAIAELYQQSMQRNIPKAKFLEVFEDLELFVKMLEHPAFKKAVEFYKLHPHEVREEPPVELKPSELFHHRAKFKGKIHFQTHKSKDEILDNPEKTGFKQFMMPPDEKGFQQYKVAKDVDFKLQPLKFRKE